MCCAAAAVRNAEPKAALFKCLCCSDPKEVSTLGPVVDLWVYVHFQGCAAQSHGGWCDALLEYTAISLG